MKGRSKLLKMEENPSVAHLSSGLPSWSFCPFSTSYSNSSRNSEPSVSHWTSSSTNQILSGCRKRPCNWSKVISRPMFSIHRFFLKIVKSLGTTIDVIIWSFIHIGRSQTSILLRSLYWKLLNAVVCCVHMVYLRLILMLTWHCMLRLCRGRNVVLILCESAAPPACCTEPNASMFTHTHLNMDSSFIQGGSTPTKPFRSNHFCIFEECKICGGHLFSILLVEGDRCVCECENKSEKERLPQSVNLLWLDLCVALPLCTQCKETLSKSTELVSKMSGMLTYTVPDVKYIHSLLLCVCVCASWGHRLQ